MTNLSCEFSQLLLIGHHQGDEIIVIRIAVDADVVHMGVGEQDGLDLAETDVLAVVQLEQVFLAICKETFISNNKDRDSPMIRNDPSARNSPISPVANHVLPFKLMKSSFVFFSFL
jgi:hypothetical protein